MIARNDLCWCGNGKKWKKCHHPFFAPQSFQRMKEEYFKKYQIVLKTPEQIERIRAAGKLAATILKKVCAKAKEGVTTQELDDYAMVLHKEVGATPAPLGYGHPPFPKVICTSLNEVICHGIPNERPLVNGDIMNIDVTSILNGYYGDCSAMVTIGEITEEKQKVVDVSYECLMRAIRILKPGILLSEIGRVIEDCATSEGCSVVNQFVAHGVGVDFHEAPQIPHNYNNIDISLVAGMTFTIEPMINAGAREGKIDPNDHWTARTLDGKPSAQWEHTLLITDESYEILTLP
ncbi:MAG: methionyl aminopeptidase [Candidatus Neptunochlamydia sp.]|nr:methionyl aminopeptidase [Candidatus Neptunochlamydia sp.]